MEETLRETKKKETLLKGHRIHLNKRSELAREAFSLKSRRRAGKDTNAIVSLNSIFKKSKKHALDIKRTSTLARRSERVSVKGYKLLFAVRNHQSVESSVSRSALQSMGLSQTGTGIFLSNSETSLKALGKVLPFVYYGPPSLRHVQQLLHKRGTVALTTGGVRLLNSNAVVEEHLQHEGILCIADLVETIYNGSETAEIILSKLGPMQLSSINTDDTHKYGDIGASINDKLDSLI